MANKAILTGNIGNGMEFRFGNDGTCFANFSVATTEYWRDRTNGERREKTEWHDCYIAGKLAESLKKIAEREGTNFKGRSVYIDGPLQHRKFTSQQDVEVEVQVSKGKVEKRTITVPVNRQSTEVRVQNFEFTGRRPQSEGAGQAPGNGNGNDHGGWDGPDLDSEIPF